MASNDDNLGAIREYLCEHIDELVTKLLPAAQISDGGREWRVGDVTGAPGRSLAIHRHGAKAGVWMDWAYDSATDKGRDPLDLICAVQGFDNAGHAAKWARENITGAGAVAQGDGQRARQERQQQRDSEREERRQAARRLWDAARAADPDGMVAAYMGARALRRPDGTLPELPADVRYMRACQHYRKDADGSRVCDHAGPAIIAAIRDSEGALLGCQRTWLNRDGTRKASVDPNKQSLGPIQGGAIQIAGEGSILYVCEGLEDALATYIETGVSVYAVTGSEFMPYLDVSKRFRGVVIRPDNDPDKTDALAKAEKLGQRLESEGFVVSFEVPPKGLDVNDIWAQAAL